MKEKRCVVPARPLDIAHTRPAQASLTLRPAGLLNRLKRPLSRGSGPAGYPAEPLVSYQINRQLSGWNLPPLVIRAFGAHCQQQTCSLPYRITAHRTTQFPNLRETLGDQRLCAGHPVVAAMSPKGFPETRRDRRPRNVPSPRSRGRWQFLSPLSSME
jgi:hypothetical protein